MALPTDRDPRCPFDPPEDLLGREPISRMTYPDGHEGWLVTGYAAARAVLADPRFSSRMELRRSPTPHAMAQEAPRPAPPGVISRLDPPEHTHYRRLLTGEFTVRRMKLLEPKIEELAEWQIEEMRRQGPPADLVQTFALPIPSLVICDLLGVPYADRERFQHDTAVMFSLDASAEAIMGAVGSLAAYLGELVARKRVESADDLLSGLITGGTLNDEELINIALMLLVAGHETTANMLALGTYALLREPDRLAELRHDPSLIKDAVEELLRYLSIVHIGPTRTALADVEVGGRLVREGEVVTISLPAANRDPGRFERPDRLDFRRSATGHLAFGHGLHQCLGQQLARVEMRIGYTALLRAFPDLRLAVPAEEIPLRDSMLIYGVDRLPVAW
ncbi:cytochrome P450 [Nonomuraea jabiensis]|uniref:cytochrome P450 n=1 Tax=Nonomuraea jabiensis TaxID=882448 RepID=UPI00342F6C42